MAWGLPVIASVIAGVSELVEDNVNGVLLHNVTNPAELDSLMRRLLVDRRLVELLSANAIKAARAQSWDSIN